MIRDRFNQVLFLRSVHFCVLLLGGLLCSSEIRALYGRVGRVSCSGCWEKEQGAVVLNCMGETVSHTISMVSYLYQTYDIRCF